MYGECGSFGDLLFLFSSSNLEGKILEKVNTSAQLSYKFLTGPDGFWCAVETSWSDEPHSHCIMSHQYLIETTLLTCETKKMEH